MYEILVDVVQNNDGSVLHKKGEKASLQEFGPEVLENWLEIGAIKRVGKQRKKKEVDDGYRAHNPKTSQGLR